MMMMTMMICDGDDVGQMVIYNNVIVMVMMTMIVTVMVMVTMQIGDNDGDYNNDDGQPHPPGFELHDGFNGLTHLIRR